MTVEHCATCGDSLPERGPNSPEIRYCERDWWAEQRRRLETGEGVHHMALPVLVPS